MQGKLLTIRKENGVTQDDMAQLLGISIESYSRKENGKYDFKATEMFLIADYFEKEIGDIFTAPSTR